MEINGIAHLQLTVNDLQRAMLFYEEVLAFMGMQAVVKNPEFLYMIGGRTAVAITRSSAENRDAVFDQRRIGLHHVCFRARSREDVDALHVFLRERGVRIVHPPEEGTWAPGYYSLLFEDPEGIRLEVNFVPGKGHLENPQRLPLSRLP
ncbi:MAG TPA: VOC family protein [Steroidobacteraceae bacterium]|jgi:Lactoylglutathione lyase and related lyases|nr:VOC family protein [Steroidobacteraceae bacterium]